MNFYYDRQGLPMSIDAWGANLELAPEGAAK